MSRPKIRRISKQKASSSTIADWANIRRRIIERDNYQCRMRGCDEIDGLNVHHIDYDRTKNNDENLVTLCGKCHRQVHRENYKPCLYEDWPVPWGDSPPEEFPLEG